MALLAILVPCHAGISTPDAMVPRPVLVLAHRNHTIHGMQTHKAHDKGINHIAWFQGFKRLLSCCCRRSPERIRPTECCCEKGCTLRQHKLARFQTASGAKHISAQHAAKHVLVANSPSTGQGQQDIQCDSRTL
eukprot:1744741-Amphidinium_carterae.1